MSMEQPAEKLRTSLATAYDRRGLVWGYLLASAQPVGLDGMSDVVRTGADERTDGPGPLWLHFNLTDRRAREWLDEHAALPRAALATLLDPQPRVRVQLLPAALVGIIDDLHHDFHGDPEGFGELRFYVDEARVISARRHPLRGIDELRRALESGGSVPSTASWLEQLVETLAKSFGETVRDLADKVDDLEDEIVAGQGRDQRATLADIRRLLVRFRRHLSADRHALGRLRAHDGFDSAQPTPLRQALDHLDGVAQDLELVHERVRLLQDEVAGILAEATNRNLYLLSVVTTVLLPTTVVTGLWGMNVGGLPWSENPDGFLYASLGVLGSILLSLALLRGTRVL